MTYYLKTERGAPAQEIGADTAQSILKRGRHQGRRVDEVFVLLASGTIDRYLERTRRKLGSNAISSRTWLAETYQPGQPDEWGNDRYVPNPDEAIEELGPAAEAVMLVLTGAEGDWEANVEQLSALKAHS